VTGPIPSVAPQRSERSADFGSLAVRLVGRLRPERGQTAAVVALAVVGTAIAVIVPRILGQATDQVVAGVLGGRLSAGTTKEQAIQAARSRGDSTFADLLSRMNVKPGVGVDFAAVGGTLLLALGLYLLAALVVWVQARLVNVTVQRAMVTLRSDVEDKVHRLPLSYFDSQPRGELLSRVTNDIDNIQTALSTTINQLLTAVLTVIGLLAMMLTISPLLAVITLLTVPLSLVVTRQAMRRSQPLFVAQWTNTGRLNAHIEETYSGDMLVKTFGLDTWSQEQFRDLNADVYHASFWAQFIAGLLAPAMTFIGNLSYVGVAVVGGLQVATGQITVGGIQAFIQYVRQFNQPLAQAAAMTDTLQTGIAGGQRVFDLLDEPEQEPDAALGLPRVDGWGGRVEFRHVNFSYRPGTQVIDNLSLLAEPGSTVAIVGPTGAGKTTLVNLLMRFYEVDSGRILIDGVDISTVSRHSLRSRIGMVLQDTWLFGGTIAENIGYGRPGATGEEIVEAVKAVYVDRFVQTLPDGYDTWVSDDGGSISAGEKQLITIARAFLSRPQLLILDEAMSSVDTRTEALIQRAMGELRRVRTSFVIAHRLSTIRDADLILVMEGGRIVEQGSHAELLARRGAYYEMTRLRAGWTVDDRG
jgi:ABC-type multidrug transport system fused ATPase/permease subunit